VKKPAHKPRARNLTDDDIDRIALLIDGWSGKLTWKLLIEAIADRTAQTYTRQTLAKHTKIQLAFEHKEIKPAPEKPVSLSPELEAAEQTIERLEATVKRLTYENNSLIEQFVRWAHNASFRGLDEDFLNQPLPPVDRERTKEDRQRLGKVPTPKKGAS
jgi:hypothetical protein